MTHDELLAKVTAVYDFISQDNREFDDLDKCVFALRAVVELHKQENENGYCEICPDFDYPCETIQAIEKELK